MGPLLAGQVALSRGRTVQPYRNAPSAGGKSGEERLEKKGATPNDAISASCSPSPSCWRRPFQAPHPRPVRRDPQEREAVEHRELALVDERQQRIEPMRHPVREGHESRAKKRRPTRREPHHDERPAHELDRSRRPNDEGGRTGQALVGWEAEHLLHPVPKEEEADHDAEERIGLSLVSAEKVRHARPFAGPGGPNQDPPAAGRYRTCATVVCRHSRARPARPMHLLEWTWRVEIE